MINPAKLVTILLVSFPLWTGNQNIATRKSQGPRNVILLIGDGMGVSQLSTAYFYGEGEPAFSRFPVVGLIKTSSAKQKITDSAAGATAFACGQKTYNGAIGVDVDTSAIPSLVDYFEKKGARTGVVATSSVTHATPASFYAHAASRNYNTEIAHDLLDSHLDFICGGGSKYFDADLISDLEAKGWVISNNLGEPSTENNKTRFGYLLAEDGLPRMSDGRGDYLTRATMMAIEFLKGGDRGFFLMTEASQIDWGGHANDGDYIVQEVLDFDQCLAAVLDFAERDGNTLVIVTADHETGGFTLAGKEKKVPFMGSQRDYDDFELSFSTGGHSAALVPVLAYGPGAQEFAGIYENTEIYHKILRLVGR